MELPKTKTHAKILTKDHKHSKFGYALEDKQWKDSFYFVQGADIQFGFIESYFNKDANPNWEKEKELAELCVQKINALRPKPKFFVICGDLCHTSPQTDPKMRKEQESDFYRIFSKIDDDIPLVCVCGNHDIGDSPTEDSVKSYRSSFGDDYFSFWVGGVHFVVINSQYYVDSSNVKSLSSDHGEWLDKVLNSGEKSHHGPVLFQHIPWAISDDENDVGGYFCIRKDIRDPMLDKLVKAGVRYVFAGHNHKNILLSYKGMEHVTTSAIGGQLGNDTSGIRIVKVLRDRITHQYYDLNQVPTDISF